MNTPMKRSSLVLLVGLHQDAVDYSKWPGLDRKMLSDSFLRTRERLEKEGFTTKWCLTAADESAEIQLSRDIREFQPEVIMIGAGIREDPDLLPLFERLVNRIIHLSPKSKIAFNTSLEDTVSAVKRWSDQDTLRNPDKPGS